MSEAKKFFKEVKNHPDRYYIIHYSCETLFDEGVEQKGMSPRITSIVVMQFETQQTLSFSLHTVAEQLHFSRDEVQVNYDAIEQRLLEQFYAFVRDRRQNHWIHWNMRNQTFGFEHLEHRYRVLTGNEPPVIPIEVRQNLNDVLRDKYGSGYAPHPRMLKLMLLNGTRDQRFLDGKEESAAFKAKEFIRMNTSTISKVEFFRHVIVLAQRGKLKTDGFGFVHGVDRLLDHRWARVIAFFGTIFGIIQGSLRLLGH